ncbi:MAG: hypothetical protein ABIA74_03830 [bacterium]
MTNKQAYFAEVIESSLDNFLAQCWQWDFFPEFGSLIQAQNEDILTLGVVTQIQTGSMDPMRYPFAYQKTEEELIEQQPQIFEFLKTTFKVQIIGFANSKKSPVRPACPSKSRFEAGRRLEEPKGHLEGYSEKNNFYYHLPSKPCKIHSFIKKADKELSSLFFSNPDFLHMLFGYSSQITNLDELLITILKNLKINNELTSSNLSNFCQTFSILTNNDYRRMKSFLCRIESL